MGRGELRHSKVRVAETSTTGGEKGGGQSVGRKMGGVQRVGSREGEGQPAGRKCDGEIGGAEGGEGSVLRGE